MAMKTSSLLMNTSSPLRDNLTRKRTKFMQKQEKTLKKLCPIVIQLQCRFVRGVSSQGVFHFCEKKLRTVAMTHQDLVLKRIVLRIPHNLLGESLGLPSGLFHKTTEDRSKKGYIGFHSSRSLAFQCPRPRPLGLQIEVNFGV